LGIKKAVESETPPLLGTRQLDTVRVVVRKLNAGLVQLFLLDEDREVSGNIIPVRVVGMVTSSLGLPSDRLEGGIARWASEETRRVDVTLTIGEKDFAFAKLGMRGSITLIHSVCYLQRVEKIIQIFPEKSRE
jgi:hypothetical protein